MGGVVKNGIKHTKQLTMKITIAVRSCWVRGTVLMISCLLAYLSESWTLNYDNSPAIAGIETDYIVAFTIGWEL